MKRTFTKAEYLDALRVAGWLDAVDARERARLEDVIGRTFAKSKKLSSGDSRLFLGVATTMFDAEMIEGSGPDDPCSYHSLVTQLAGASFGRFAPVDLHDEIDWTAQRARVSFVLRGKTFRVEMPCDSDWVDHGVLDLVNESLAKTNDTHRFQMLPAVDQCIYLAFVPDAVWKKALMLGVVPEQDEIED